MWKTAHRVLCLLQMLETPGKHTILFLDNLLAPFVKVSDQHCSLHSTCCQKFDTYCLSAPWNLFCFPLRCNLWLSSDPDTCRC